MIDKFFLLMALINFDGSKKVDNKVVEKKEPVFVSVDVEQSEMDKLQELIKNSEHSEKVRDVISKYLDSMIYSKDNKFYTIMFRFN